MTLAVNYKDELIITEIDDDMQELYKYKWHAVVKQRDGYKQIYFKTFDNGNNTYLHRLILNAPNSMQVDHIDRNTLNNKRSNLRLATPSQNMANKKGWSKTGYKGVLAVGKETYQARIKVDGVVWTSQIFRDLEEAAIAYEIMAKNVHGEYAYSYFQ